MPLTKIQSLGITDGAIVAADIASGAITAAKLASGVGGKVLQVVQAVKTDTSSTTSTSAVDISGLSVSITPSSASNKILILVQIGTAGQSNFNNRDHFLLSGGNTSTYKGDTPSAGYRTSITVCPRGSTDGQYSQIPAQITYLDSPATTAATTYKVQFFVDGGTGYINRSGTVDGNTGATASTITVMEIAA
jgi:hypothetical protein